MNDEEERKRCTVIAALKPWLTMISTALDQVSCRGGLDRLGHISTLEQRAGPSAPSSPGDRKDQPC